MAQGYRVTTHESQGGYFTAEVNGQPLLGPKGGYSKFSSRKEARDEAHRRMKLEHNQHLKKE